MSQRKRGVSRGRFVQVCRVGLAVGPIEALRWERWIQGRRRSSPIRAEDPRLLSPVKASILTERETPMVGTQQARRQSIVRKLDRVDRAIAATQKRLAEIEARMAVLIQATAKAA